jgi:hypothetical protein
MIIFKLDLLDFFLENLDLETLVLENSKKKTKKP